MVEAPLVVKPYLARLTRAELFMVMACGMATVAGTVMALYGAILLPVVPDALGHILIASIVATPAALVVAALMVPGEMSREAGVDIPRQDAGAMDAVTRGTVEGVQLLIQVIAMPHRAGGAGAPGERGAGPPAPLRRRPPHAAARARLGVRAARLDGRRALGRGAGRWRAARDENDPERVHRLSRPRETAGGGDVAAIAAV